MDKCDGGDNNKNDDDAQYANCFLVMSEPWFNASIMVVKRISIFTISERANLPKVRCPPLAAPASFAPTK